MTIEARKHGELDRKLQSLASEFGEWRKLGAENGELEKHHTQIDRLTRQLGALAGVVTERLKAPAPADVLRESRAVELMILEMHRVWDFFRTKLLQRRMSTFVDYLAVADDLAWACYQPARALAVAAGTVKEAAVKEPPLVFFNGASSPFAMSRDIAYQAEAVPYEAMSTPQFVALLAALPVPVIGLPWFQVEHLPDMLLVAHEVAHNVEDDLKLTGTLQTIVATSSVPHDRRAAWVAWSGEVFADVYGTLALGPAFVGSLMDFLAGDPAAVQGQWLTGPQWGTYPTDWLRIQIVLHTLTRAGFATERVPLATDWQKTYPTHAMGPFLDDVSVVVDALLDSPWPPLGGAQLKAVVPFGAVEQEAAESHATALLASDALTTSDIRQLLAAARIAYARDPAGYQAKARKLVDRATAVRAPGVRAGDDAAPVPEAADRGAGQALFALLSTPAR